MTTENSAISTSKFVELGCGSNSIIISSAATILKHSSNLSREWE
jgi:hypothetical protein